MRTTKLSARGDWAPAAGAIAVAGTCGACLVACAGLVGVSDVDFDDAGMAQDAPAVADGSGGDGSKGDGGAGSEAGTDAPLPADGPGPGEGGAEGGPPTTAPRPISPLSTAHVMTRRPSLHWLLPTGVADATVDLCRDRACSNVIASTHVVGSTFTPATDLAAGAVFWRVHPATDLALTSPTWEFFVPVVSGAVDTSWGTVFDPNGDGYADVVVGAFLAERVFVYPGSASGLDVASVTSILTPNPASGDDFGASVASAGDVDGDGFADLVVGTRDTAGVAIVYRGGPPGISDTISTTITGAVGANGLVGGPVTSAGDLNGDGYADVAIGSPGLASNDGKVYVYLGGPTGLSSTPAYTLSGPAASGGLFGSALASAGDVDGDGYPELAVGAHEASGGTGQVFLYAGSAAGLQLTPKATLTGPEAQSSFGYSVAGAGDVNGDGYPDLVVGAVNAGSQAGAAYVYTGGSSGLATPAATTLGGPAGTMANFGWSVACAGDTDGDGFADVIVGAPNDGTSSTGRMYLYRGAGTGLTVSPRIFDGPDGTYTEFGASVASAGDVDRDGYADVVVGAFGGFMQQASYPGAAHLYVGGATGLSAAPTPSIQGPQAQSYFGYSVFGASD